jgi:alpha-glucosidase
MTRWFEIGAFTPIFRDHSEKDKPRAEPWVDGPAQLAIRRRFVEERYRLMPYLYALADLNSRTGDPLMRPVFYDYPDAAQTSCDQSMTFTLGAALLIAPPPKMESPQAYDICLPKGGWYDYWTGKAVIGSSTISKTPSLESLPVFVRAGTILPRQPLVQSTAETPRGPLYLEIYPGDDCAGTIYLDDGHSMGFEKGHFLRQTVRCALDGRNLVIDFEPREGDYAPWWNRIQVIVHGRSKEDPISSSTLPIQAVSNSATGAIEFTVPDVPKGGRISIARGTETHGS